MKKTLSAVLISLVMALLFAATSLCTFADEAHTVSLDGVQIRLTSERGIRFFAKVSGTPADYDEVGMLIIPQNLLMGELTLDTPNAKKVSSANEGFNYFDSTKNAFRYTLCLINVTHERYGRNFVVRPYVKYTENGEQITLYADNYPDYILSAAQFTEYILEDYADKYTRELKADHDAIDNILTDYNRYLDDLAASQTPPAEEEPETEEILLTEITDWYWRLGTLGSSNGVANPANNKRMFTPGYIPAENTVITFDGASGVSYIVMEYDSDKNWLSTSGWITKDTYTRKNENAAYYRCVLTDNTTLTKDDVAEMSRHLTVRVPLVSARCPVELTFAQGTITGATGVANPSSTTRVYTPDYYSTKGLFVDYDLSNSYVDSFTLLGYKEDTTFAKGYGDKRIATLNIEEAMPESALVRFVHKLKSGLSIKDGDISDYTGHLSAYRIASVPYSAFEVGGINAQGVGDGDSTAVFADSSEYAHTMGYIPNNVSFTFDSTIGGQYSVYWYDSSYAFVSASEMGIEKNSPKAPAGAAFYRICVKPAYEVTEDTADYAASAFSFCREAAISASEWELGTINGSTGEANTSRADRIYTPAYYPAKGLTVNYTKNSYTNRYILLAYDADKKFIGTSGDLSKATTIATDVFPTAEYIRFAVKLTGTITAADVAAASSALNITSVSALFVPTVYEVEAAPSFPTFGDEGLEFRFSFSLGSLSPGNYQSGMCEVEDELWLFSTSDKGTAGDGYGVILRYKPDYENGTAEYMGHIGHNFGHANSVDYSAENKCIVIGNGSGSFTNTNNFFYVYKNPYELAKAGEEALEIADENCITYAWSDCGVDRMTKLNTCWYGRNSVFVGANNNGYVYKIALGTGERVLSYGTANGAADGEFNGTWDIIKSYEMSDNYDNAQAAGYRGQGYDQCNQGTDYANGTLYLTCGHDGIYFWRCRLDSDGTIKRDEFHKYMTVGGTTHTSAISGIVSSGEHLIFTNGGYVNIYRNDALR
ncbi:MAG: hypothetical protein IKV97_03040 [Clostridia bacterium]|nr:hypothetical protein [Clostridia bacterium]